MSRANDAPDNEVAYWRSNAILHTQFMGQTEKTHWFNVAGLGSKDLLGNLICSYWHRNLWTTCHEPQQTNGYIPHSSLTFYLLYQYRWKLSQAADKRESDLMQAKKHYSNTAVIQALAFVWNRLLYGQRDTVGQQSIISIVILRPL